MSVVKGAATALAVMVLAGCAGSGLGGDAGSTPSSEFFVSADSDALNGVLSQYNEAVTDAASDQLVIDCSDTNRIAKQSRCLIGLLEPLSAALVDVSAELAAVGSRESLNEACHSAVGAGIDEVDAYTADVDDLITDLGRTKKRKVYAAAIDRYFTVLDERAASLNEALRTLTVPCYSPEDLANASAAASPPPS